MSTPRARCQLCTGGSSTGCITPPTPALARQRCRSRCSATLRHKTKRSGASVLPLPQPAACSCCSHCRCQLAAERSLTAALLPVAVQLPPGTQSAGRRPGRTLTAFYQQTDCCHWNQGRRVGRLHIRCLPNRLLLLLLLAPLPLRLCLLPLYLHPCCHRCHRCCHCRRRHCCCRVGSRRT